MNKKEITKKGNAGDLYLTSAPSTGVDSPVIQNSIIVNEIEK